MFGHFGPHPRIISCLMIILIFLIIWFVHHFLSKSLLLVSSVPAAHCKPTFYISGYLNSVYTCASTAYEITSFIAPHCNQYTSCHPLYLGSIYVKPLLILPDSPIISVYQDSMSHSPILYLSCS